MSAELRVSEYAGSGGFIEISVYEGDALRGIVTHPCRGAKWFLHLPKGGSRGQKFQSRAKAMAAIVPEPAY